MVFRQTAWRASTTWNEENYARRSTAIAQLQYVYDQSVAQLSEGRKGLEQYRALVERVTRQVQNDQRHVTDLESKVKAYLQAGDRETAAKFALEMQKAKTELAENQGQLKLHEEAYNNNISKVKHATGKLSKIREKIARYDAELKMSKAEAEVANLCRMLRDDLVTEDRWFLALKNGRANT